MHNQILRLYPLPGESVKLNNLYLNHQLHKQGQKGKPFVYANFLSSLDGRIALEDERQDHPPYIPDHLTTDSDFRLFMELHAQADCLITHGGYMRALHENRLGNILQIRHDDLKQWRKDQGLPDNPAVVIASASLDFPMHPSLKQHNQTVYIATGKNADPERIRYWQDQGYEILFSGDDLNTQGDLLVAAIAGLGYQSIYLIAGPQMLSTMLEHACLSRMYLSVTHQLTGGNDFRTVLTGPLLNQNGNLKLTSLYYQNEQPEGSGQFFMQFEPAMSKTND